MASIKTLRDIQLELKRIENILSHNDNIASSNLQHTVFDNILPSFLPLKLEEFDNLLREDGSITEIEWDLFSSDKQLKQIFDGDCLPAAIVVTKFSHDTGLKFAYEPEILTNLAEEMRTYLKDMVEQRLEQEPNIQHFEDELPKLSTDKTYLSDASLTAFSGMTNYTIWGFDHVDKKGRQLHADGNLFTSHITGYATSDRSAVGYKLVRSKARPHKRARPALLIAINRRSKHWYGMGEENMRYWTITVEKEKKTSRSSIPPREKSIDLTGDTDDDN